MSIAPQYTYRQLTIEDVTRLKEFDIERVGYQLH